jgi:hypothetical protein
MIPTTTERSTRSGFLVTWCCPRPTTPFSSLNVIDWRRGLRSCPRGSIVPAVDAFENLALLSQEELPTLVAELRRQVAHPAVASRANQ